MHGEGSVHAPAMSRANSKILLIDDDEKMSVLLSKYLAPHGYAVTAVHDGLEGAEQVLTGQWNMVILDIMLPGIDGFELLKKIRARSSIPVLMLTARSDESDRIVGLEVGADDYVTKTSSSRELLARIRALLRRAYGPQSHAGRQDGEIVVGALRLDLDSYRTFVDGHNVALTAIEFNLLASMAKARGKVKTREQLFSEVSEREFNPQDRAIDVHVSMLRRKLGDHSGSHQYIRTVRGIGYMLVSPYDP
ncbi:MAG: ompR [Nevskia sp.]|nr:ompR [Nevskia sp.]